MVAFNPAQLTQGVGQTFDLAGSLDRLRAFRAAQKELDATRLTRVAEQNAKSEYGAAKAGSDLSLIAPLAKETLAKSTLGTALAEGNLGNVGLSTEADKAKLEHDITKFYSDRSTIPDEAMARTAIANLNAGRAQKDLSSLGIVSEMEKEDALTRAAQSRGLRGILPNVIGAQDIAAQRTIAEGRGAIENAGARAAVDRIKMELEAALTGTQLATLPDKYQLELFKLKNALDNAQTDADRARLAEQTKILLDQAKIGEADANAAYLMGEGRQSGQQKSLADQEKEIAQTIATLGALPVGDGRTLSVWINENIDPETWRNKNLQYDNSGRPVGNKQGPFHALTPLAGIGRGERNPTAELYVEKMRQLQQDLAMVRRQMQGQPQQQAGQMPLKMVMGQDGVWRPAK